MLENEGCSNQNRVEAWDPTDDSWETRASLPIGLGHIAPSTIATLHGIVIVSGAINKAGDLCPLAWAAPTDEPRKVS